MKLKTTGFMTVEKKNPLLFKRLSKKNRTTVASEAKQVDRDLKLWSDLHLLMLDLLTH